MRALLLPILVVFLGLPCRADDGVVPHRLKSGETLVEVASRCGATVDELRACNAGIDETALAAGTVVLLPVSARWLRHEVARGDTLYGLSRRYGADVDEIVVASGLSGTSLEVGQVLVIPRVREAESNAPEAPANETPGVRYRPVTSQPRTVVVPARTQAAVTLPPATRPANVVVPGVVPPTRPVTVVLSPTRPVAVVVPPARPVAVVAPPANRSVASAGDVNPATTTPLPAWVEVRLKDGRRAWAPSGGLIVESPGPAGPARIVEIARQFNGVPYRWGGETPNGADCSGYVEEVFRLGGYKLPRTADVQFQVTLQVAADQMMPGDLVFFTTYEPGPSHVGIYLGDGRFIHASSSRGVTESRLDETYYAQRFLGARRIAQWSADPRP